MQGKKKKKKNVINEGVERIHPLPAIVQSWFVKFCHSYYHDQQLLELYEFAHLDCKLLELY